MATAPGWAGQDAWGPYWVQPETGTIQRQSNKILALALQPVWVPFDTYAHAKAFADGNQASKVKQVAKGAAGAATSTADFLSRLTSPSLWVRVGEVVAGLILLGIGLNSMLKGKPLQIVTGAAGKVGKVAML